MMIPPKVSVLRDAIDVEQRQFLPLTRRPARLTLQQAEWCLGLASLNILHDVPIPTRKPLAHDGHVTLPQLYGP